MMGVLCAGILLVVALGVALGVFVGGTLLTVVAFCMKKSVSSCYYYCCRFVSQSVKQSQRLVRTTEIKSALIH